MWHGMFLFLLGLLTGFGESSFANVRMGLAAHLEGVMNGIFLLALGSAWTQLRLPSATAMIAFWAVLCVRNENFSQIRWHTVYHARGDRFLGHALHSTALRNELGSPRHDRP